MREMNFVVVMLWNTHDVWAGTRRADDIEECLYGTGGGAYVLCKVTENGAPGVEVEARGLITRRGRIVAYDPKKFADEFMANLREWGYGDEAELLDDAKILGAPWAGRRE